MLEAVARLEPRWETELSDVEFAVQEVPDFDTIGEDGIPLARIVRGSPDTSDPANPASWTEDCSVPQAVDGSGRR